MPNRSKAVDPLLFLFCVASRFIIRGASRFKVYPCFLSSCFVIPFSIVITSLAENGAGLCASRAYVCFVRVSFCHFSLPLYLYTISSPLSLRLRLANKIFFELSETKATISLVPCIYKFTEEFNFLQNYCILEESSLVFSPLEQRHLF